MCSFVDTKAVVDRIFKSVLSNRGLLVPISKTVGNMVDSSGDGYHLCEMKEASTAVAGEQSFESMLSAT